MIIEKTGYHGLYFPELNISLDGYHPDAEATFITHAHADHMTRNRSANVFATAATHDFMQLRGFRGTSTPVEFGEKISLDSVDVTFFPAGHILGSAMIYLEHAGGTLLYTGDYRTPPSPASEGFAAPDNVDILITEATFSLPIYKWRSHEELTAEIHSFVTDSLNDGYTPILLAYNLGKAQELMHLLAPLNHPMMIHGAGFKLCPVYEKHGINLGNFSAYNHEECKDKILITPSSALSKGFASNLSKTRIAYCSGWAANESRRTQLTVDKMIPISDHLDFFELIRFCKELAPKKVYITHTPNPDVVQHYLTKKNIDSAFLNFETAGED